MVWQYATSFSTPVVHIYTRRDGIYEAEKKSRTSWRFAAHGPATDDSAEQGGNVKPASVTFEKNGAGEL
jgi:hypothetical protein